MSVQGIRRKKGLPESIFLTLSEGTENNHEQPVKQRRLYESFVRINGNRVATIYKCGDNSFCTSR